MNFFNNLFRSKLKVLLVSLPFALFLVSFTIKSLSTLEVETGDYYIINLETGEALTPVSSSVNSNVYLSNSKKSGLQKWTITQKASKLKSGDFTYTYTIMQKSSGFFLRPYFIPDNHSSIISGLDNNSVFIIDGELDNCIIKSKAMGGDVMYSKKEYSSNEAWFGPEEDSDSGKWELKSAQ